MIKKYLLGMFALLMVATLSVGFTSCGDDDDEELFGGGKTGKGGVTASYFVGTWRLIDAFDQEIVFTFKSNGTGSYLYVYMDGGSWKVGRSEGFVWQYDEESWEMRLKFSKSVEYYDVIPVSKTVVMFDGDEYQKD